MSSSLKPSSWTTKQRKKLLQAMREYPVTAYKSLAKRVQTKDAQDVKEFIDRMKQEIKRKQLYKGVRKEVVNRAPLEEWLEISRDLVEYEHVDSSSSLSKVMAIISNFEDLPAPADPSDPDYRRIYKFISQALQVDRQEDLVALSPIECSIMLDMMHYLMEVLSDHDLTVHRNVMQWKYLLMESRDENGHVVPDLLKKASENDFSAFIEERVAEREKELKREKIYMARRAKIDETGRSVTVKKVEAPSGKISSASATIARANKSQTFVHSGDHGLPHSHAVSAAVHVSRDRHSVSELTITGVAPPTAVSESSISSETRPTLTSPTASLDPSTYMQPESSQSSLRISTSSSAAAAEDTATGKQASHASVAEAAIENYVSNDPSEDAHKRRTKPGRKGALDPPEIPRTEIYLVMPPKGAEIVNYSPRVKRAPKSRLDGKYRALDQEENLINDDYSREITYDVHRSELEQFKKAGKKLISNVISEDKQRMLEREEMHHQHVLSLSKKKREGEQEMPVKKPKLYSLNPFCLPVSLIDLDSK